MRRHVLAATAACIALLCMVGPIIAQSPDEEVPGCGTVCWDACCLFGQHQYDLNSGAGNYTGKTSHPCQLPGYHGQCYYAPGEEDLRAAYDSTLRAARRGV